MSTLGELTIQTEIHPSGRWITVPLVVGRARRISPVLDTGAPVSGISPRIEALLLANGLLRPGTTPNRHHLVELSVANQPLPDIEVAVIRRLDRLDVDGLLGLDFLSLFERIHFHTRSLQLILESG